MRRSPAALLALLTCLIGALLAMPAGASASPNVQFGIEQFGNMENPVYTDEFQKIMRRDGATLQRYIVRWDWVAASCDPATRGRVNDMNNPCYSWGYLDAIVSKARSHGLGVLFSIYGTPRWMFGQPENYVGTTDAEYARFTTSYAAFAQAVATRYDGAHGQPRVPQITIWNEPNGSFFQPRWINGVTVGPVRYARLVDAAARSIKQVDPSRLVAAGPTAPHAAALPPMTFAGAALDELDRLGTPIDAWAHNAYTGSQSPLKNTIVPPYVGLGNISDLTGLLDQHSVTRGKPVWITEFGYQTSGGQKAIEPEQQPALLADALYFAWRQPRIDTFIWYQLHDDTYTNPYDFMSGLYYAKEQVCGGTLCPKPGAAMFRHTVWASERPANGVVTLWAQGRSEPAKTRLFVRRPGDSWRSYVNTDTATTGTVYLRMSLPVGSIAMSCDTTCGPTTTVRAATVAGGGGTSSVKQLPAITLGKRMALRRGISLDVACAANCTVTGTLRAKGAASGIAAAKRRVVIVGRGTATRGATKTKVRFTFTAPARRELGRRTRGQVTLRIVIRYTDGHTETFDRLVRLR